VGVSALLAVIMTVCARVIVTVSMHTIGFVFFSRVLCPVVVSASVLVLVPLVVFVPMVVLVRVLVPLPVGAL
jgi:hypothetical protein